MKADQWSVMKAAPLSTLTTAAIATAIALIVVPLPGEHLTLQASIQDDETTGDYDYWLQVSKQTAGALTPGALRRQRRRSPLPRGSAGGGSDVAGLPAGVARPTYLRANARKRAPAQWREGVQHDLSGTALARTPRTSQILCTHSLRARGQGGRCAGG